MIRYPQQNFSKGVISERLLGRLDVSAYNAGLRVGSNIVVLKWGGFSIRAGTHYVSEGAEGERPIAFKFSSEQAYALFFGDLYMQPLANGGVVLEEELDITGITNANPAVITAAFHGNEAGDDVFLSGIGGDLGDYLNGRVVKVLASLGDDTFSIDFSTVGLPAFTDSEGGITRADPPDPPEPPPPTPVPTPPPAPPPVYDGGDPGYREPRYNLPEAL